KNDAWRPGFKRSKIQTGSRNRLELVTHGLKSGAATATGVDAGTARVKRSPGQVMAQRLQQRLGRMDHLPIGKLRKDLVVDELEQGKVNEIEPIGTHFLSRLSKMALKLKHSAQVSRIVWDHQAGIRERPQPLRAEFAWPPSGRVSVKWIGADES